MTAFLTSAVTLSHPSRLVKKLPCLLTRTVAPVSLCQQVGVATGEASHIALTEKLVLLYYNGLDIDE